MKYKYARLLPIGVVSLTLASGLLVNSPLFAYRRLLTGQTAAPSTQSANAPAAIAPVEAKPKADTAAAPPVTLTLTAEKKVIQRDEQGHDRALWRALPPGASVLPGDVVRCSITARSHADHAIAHLQVTGPVAPTMQYLSGSAEPLPGADAGLTFSIDGGKTFSDAPTIETKLPDGSVVTRPAPESAYTHLHWRQQADLPAGGESRFTYRMRVR